MVDVMECVDGEGKEGESMENEWWCSMNLTRGGGAAAMTRSSTHI